MIVKSSKTLCAGPRRLATKLLCIALSISLFSTTAIADDLFDMSLEALIDVEITSASMFTETTNVFDIAGALISSSEGNALNYSRDVNSFILQARRQTRHQPLQLKMGARIDDYSYFGQHISPRLGAIYQVTPEHTVKLLYGTAFRAAVSIELFGTSSIEGNPSIKPEELETWELAYLFKTPRWQSELVIFKANWDNGIIALSNGAGKKYENADESGSQSIELGAQYRLNKWQISASSSWIKSENTLGDFDYLAFPEWQAKAEINYHMNSQRQIALRFDWRDERGAGPITSQATNPEPLASYLRVDANIRQQLNTWQATLSATNMFKRGNRLASLVNSTSGDPDSSRMLELSLPWKIK